MKNNIASLLKSKLQAAGIHLLISLLLFAGIFYVIYFEWYPQPLFDADGGWYGIKLMAATGLVLGPCLTLIIYNYLKTRKEILFDLSVIALIQISALVWGGLQVYSQRPVALVMWEGMFFTVTEDYYQKQGKTLQDIAAYSNEKPLLIYAEKDASVEQLKEIQRLNQQKIPPYAQLHLYKPVKDNVTAILSQQLTEDYLFAYLTEDVSRKDQYVFPAKAKYKKLLVYLDNEANLLAIKLKPEVAAN